MPEMLDIVDENGVPTGQSVPRTTAHAEGLRHRTSHVWIVRKKNGAVQVLLQMRCAAKDSYPGCYDISSAGHIPAGAKFTSSSGSNQVSVAEHILASLLAVCRRLPVYRDSQRLHQWKDRGRMKCVRGSTVLVVGAGHIGSTFAAMCQGLGAHTLGLKRTVHGPVEGFDQVFPMERLDDLLPQKLIPVAVERSGIPPHQKVHDLTREQRRELVQGLKHFSVEIAGPCPVTDAIVTSGGIKISEIDPKTMESKLVKGLYFSGEIMDVDAYTGGFNLQIAWATGRAAGQAAAEALRQGEENA